MVSAYSAIEFAAVESPDVPLRVEQIHILAHVRACTHVVGAKVNALDISSDDKLEILSWLSMAQEGLEELGSTL